MGFRPCRDPTVLPSTARQQQCADRLQRIGDVICERNASQGRRFNRKSCRIQRARSKRLWILREPAMTGQVSRSHDVASLRRWAQAGKAPGAMPPPVNEHEGRLARQILAKHHPLQSRSPRSPRLRMRAIPFYARFPAPCSTSPFRLFPLPGIRLQFHISHVRATCLGSRDAAKFVQPWPCCPFQQSPRFLNTNYRAVAAPTNDFGRYSDRNGRP